MKNIKAALAAPRIRLGDCVANAAAHIEAARAAARAGADILVFPELSLTGATLGDLYRQAALLSAAERALTEYIDSTADIPLISFIGVPLCSEGRIYDATAVVAEGEILGVGAACAPTDAVFSPAPQEVTTVTLCGQEVAFGRELKYVCPERGIKIALEVGARLSGAPADGVSLVVNPAAEAEYIGLSAKRRERLEAYSRAHGCAVAYAGAGEGESGTDGVYAGARAVAVRGATAFEEELFSEELSVVELDLDAPECPAPEAKKATRPPRFPFIPEEKAERDAACALALEIQSRALAGRLERSYSSRAVLGVSGGLDSTLAVLVAARAMDLLGRGRENVIAITMPCFGTTERTKSNALALAEELGCTVRTIDIKAAVSRHFADIGHAEDDYGVVYENAQARERTQILMDVANAEGGLVVGTGDLSELALGFATYGGDHLSMYCVNGSVPKTLMRAIIAYAADNARTEGRSRLADVLLDVINTPVSPELLPADGAAENAQHTEKIVGPYELHDFFLYHLVGGGASPDAILALAREAFGEAYTEEEIRGYLEIFVRRFFSQQFKRSCMADGPRVTEISLSPRGGWRMPSDVCASVWREYFGK